MLFLCVLALLTEDTLFSNLLSPLDTFNYYLNGTYSLSSPYKIKYIDLTRIYIKILINPCMGMSNEFCCEGMNEGMCSDNPIISKGPNLSIAWSCNNIIVVCGGAFYNSLECGSFIEVHNPNNVTIINYISISKFPQSGFHMESIYTRELSPGYYELWWTQRDRTGRWILHIKPFYIAY